MMDNINTIQYLPEIVLDKIFSSLELLDFLSCMLVCKNWYRILKYERTEPWKTICQRMIPAEELNSEFYSKLGSFKAIVRRFCHGWDPRNCSENVYIHPNGITLSHIIGSFMTVEKAYGKIGYKTGVHEWEVSWKPQRGIIGIIGVTAKKARVPFHNNDPRSWGWDIISSYLYVNNTSLVGYYGTTNFQYDDNIDYKVSIILDCERGLLLFERNNSCLGAAFTNLPKTKLYPSVLSIDSRANVSIVYVGNRMNCS